MSGKFCPEDGCRHNVGGYCAKGYSNLGLLPLGLMPQSGIGGVSSMGQPAGPAMGYLMDERLMSNVPDSDVWGTWQNCAERKTIRD